MRRWLLVLAVSVVAITGAAAQGGPLRAAYLATNPAQAVKDAATGELRGVAVDVARELARRQNRTLELIPSANPQAVIDAVQSGKAEIGFVAYNPERAGPVEFSKPYVLVNQTFLVRTDSPIASVRDIDRPNQLIGARAGDSIALYLARTLKQAKLLDLTEAAVRDAPAMLREGTLQAFGANRQRLTDILRATDGLRLLPDDLYGVEQAIIVRRGDAAALAAMNRFIDDVRRSGFLQQAIERSGVVGIAPAP